jgi:hypothetical protein
MPRIDFSFRGHVNGALVTEATDESGNIVDVSKMSPTLLTLKLNSGALFISLGDHLYESDDAEICLEDFQAPYSRVPFCPDSA